MGVVYLGHDSALGRAVAIKAIPDEWASDAERMGRFEREARLLASMNHPGIASVYGLHEHDGRRYLVMEFVEGRSLAEMLADTGAPPVDEALALGAQIAAAVEAAHDAGVVHRDLKPGNVMVGPSGKVKVLDFGLAKGTPAARSSMGVMSATPTVSIPTPQQNFSATQMGRVLGTVGYMSPEQARGKPLDRRTDVWSLGAVLYELLSGRRVFDGETQADTMAAILEREPDWSALPANTPPRVRELLARCLEKDVHRRLRDAGDARLEIEKALSNREWTSSFVANASSFGLPPARGGGGRWIAAALVGVVGLAAGVGIGALAWPRSGAPAAKADPVCFELTLGIPRDQPEFGKPIRRARLSPDGKEVAIEFADATARLAIHRFDRFETRLVAGTDACGRPVWSPDGRWIAFSMPGGRIGRIARIGGPVQVLLENSTDRRSAIWTADGRIVLGSSDEGNLQWIPEDGGTPQELVKPDGPAGIAGFDYTTVAPGADFLLSGTYFDNAIDAFNITAIDLKTGAMETVKKRGAAPLAVRPDRLLFMRDSSLFSVPFDFETRSVTGEERLIVPGVRTVDWGGYALFDVSANGTLLYAPGERGVLGRQLMRVDREGKATALFDETDAFVELLAISADGRWAAVTTLRRRMEFWVIDLQTGGRTLVDGASETYGAAFSPDGQRLAYSRLQHTKDPGIMRIAIWDRASGAVKEPELEDGSWGVSAWTSDGSALISSYVPRARMGEKIDIRSVALTPTPKATVLVDSPEVVWGGQVAPDGKWLLYGAVEAGRGELFVCPMPPNGRRWRISRDGASSGAWGEPGEIVWKWRGELMSASFGVDGERVTVGQPRVVFEHPFAAATEVPPLWPAPDGGFLMIKPSEQELNPAPVRVIMNWDGGPVE